MQDLYVKMSAVKLFFFPMKTLPAKRNAGYWLPGEALVAFPKVAQIFLCIPANENRLQENYKHK